MINCPDITIVIVKWLADLIIETACNKCAYNKTVGSANHILDHRICTSGLEKLLLAIVQKLENAGYSHFTVNHKHNFFYPTTCVHV